VIRLASASVLRLVDTTVGATLDCENNGVAGGVVSCPLGERTTVVRLAAASALRLVGTTVGATTSIAKSMELLVALYRAPRGNVQRWYNCLVLAYCDW
jgi:hypothetical protein